MADKTTLLLFTALRRGLAEPAGLPLHSGKTTAGLFPSTTPGILAAQRCLDHALLQPRDGDPRLYVLTDAGLDWLLHQASPRTVLEDLVRALEARQSESAALVAAALRMQATLEGLEKRAGQVLQHLPATPAATLEEAWLQNVVAFLSRRQSTEDCPLPEVFQLARQVSPELTIGGFHDGLRRLHEDSLIYLHPWTGPLYALPEPPFALLIGHEIAYYASPRKDQPLAA